MPFRKVSRARFNRQLTLVVSVAIFGLALFSSVTTSFEASRRMKSYLVEQGQQVAQNLARQSTLALLYHSADNAQTALKATLAFPDVLQVRILDTRGKVLAGQTKDNAQPTEHPLPVGGTTAGLWHRETSDELYFSVPVLSEATQSSPFEVEDRTQTWLGSVQVVVGKGSLNRLVVSLFVGNLLVTLAFATLLLWLIQRITRHMMRPLADLSQLMRRAEKGESNMRATPNGPQDIAEMGIAFNKMMDVLEEREFQLEQRVQRRTLKLEQTNQELETTLATIQSMQTELHRSEKMAALGSLVAGVAHELNTPIGNCVTVASAMRDQAHAFLKDMGQGTMRRSTLVRTLTDSAEGADILVRNLDRASELITSFKRVAVDRSSNLRRHFDLSQNLSEILITLEPMYKKTQFAMQCDLVDGIDMDNYPGPLGQVVTNFISNALAHGFDGRSSGTMRLSCRALDADTVEIAFSDDGIGIAPQHQSRVFDPFFTTKLGQGGSGLGMHIVYNIVTGIMGGQIALTSSPETGTTFTLTLPRSAPQMPI
ncbi:MAG: HAMP domain-containing histidine kinase [Rhodoferax sp.]|nr:HAMP domain-containing histidine kinase [Rhodoferax sp.]